MLAVADEVVSGIGLENDVEHDIAEFRIGGMAVVFPCGGFGVQLQRAGMDFAIDFHSGLDEIRTRAPVPLAELDDADRFPGSAAEIPAECSGKPQCLEFQLGRQNVRCCFRKQEWRVPD